MQNNLTTTNENLPAQYVDPVEELAAESRNGFGTLAKFAEGEWYVGDTGIVSSPEYVAHVDSLVIAWIRFDEKKVAERIMVRRGEKKRLPDRDELSFADKADWPLDSKGVARDPWVRQFYLPLIDTSGGELVTFATSSVGGRIAIGKLCDQYLNKNALPIVTLDVTSFKSKEFGKVPAPDFKVIGFEGTEIVVPEPSAAAIAEYTKEHRDAFDDTVPF